ncbi:hypothetical protein KSP40_PGU014856 [Platanthera guangdongensis]|uniref:Histidine kinase/HSP90-like ATPase domain-containing protein n=1 Tax=Platanthera guangdongensis TaxID=2320717 RepID=A0ABR2M8H4_9ASPA
MTCKRRKWRGKKEIWPVSASSALSPAIEPPKDKSSSWKWALEGVFRRWKRRAAESRVRAAESWFSAIWSQLEVSEFVESHSRSGLSNSFFPELRTSSPHSSCQVSTPYSHAPVCRQFWKAGEYPADKASCPVLKTIAELLDNTVDEVCNGATMAFIDKISNLGNNHALLIQDNGGGMDPESIRHCMSFGFSDKQSNTAIGHYGNGFKSSSMRLGADVIRPEISGWRLPLLLPCFSRKPLPSSSSSVAFDPDIVPSAAPFSDTFLSPLSPVRMGAYTLARRC